MSPADAIDDCRAVGRLALGYMSVLIEIVRFP
jgi:hypothetical protein